MKFPRFMLAAPASGSGKTMITCAVLQAFVKRKFKTASFKCGPDFIDPMFHSEIIGTKSKNLDTFFTGEDLTRYLFADTAKEADISVMEGVMGFYDGIGGISDGASSYELAKVTDTPAVLIVNCKGMSLSVLPLIRGFLSYRKDSHIQGIILNRMSKGLYEDIKQEIERTLPVKVYGYFPEVKELGLESRHLGLVTPGELKDLRKKLDRLANIAEETIDLDGLVRLAGTAPVLPFTEPEIPKVQGNPLIAVAKDAAFCFYYEDNLKLLKAMGARLVEFSPLTDRELPEDVCGLILGGGYPELYAGRLSENHTMRESINQALKGGLPCMAECGGFLYLHESLEDMEGQVYSMTGAIEGTAFRTSSLKRFGYITLTSKRDQLIARKEDTIRGHEFHYFDSTRCGNAFTARKPLRNREWECIRGTDTLAAGFPHLYYYSNLKIPFRFLTKCLAGRICKKE